MSDRLFVFNEVLYVMSRSGRGTEHKNYCIYRGIEPQLSTT